MTLLDDWIDTDVHAGKNCMSFNKTSVSRLIGDIINLIVPIYSARDVVVSAKQNLLIIHPDILVTATSVANAAHCSRKPLLSLLLKPLTDISPSLLWGNVLHEAVQRCFTETQWDLHFINTVINDLVDERFLDLVRLKDIRALSRISERIIPLQSQYSRKLCLDRFVLTCRSPSGATPRVSC